MPSYNLSFSGADTRVFAKVGSQSYLLRSVTNVSVSVHEAKGAARALGHRSVKGFSRSVATIGGSMVFTVVNDHPLIEIANAFKGVGGAFRLDDFGRNRFFQTYGTSPYLMSAGLFPPFDLQLTYVTEFPDDQGNLVAATDLITGLEFVDSGKVVGTSDLAVEYQYTFIARDYIPMGRISDISTGEITDNAQHSAQLQYNEFLNYLEGLDV